MKRIIKLEAKPVIRMGQNMCERCHEAPANTLGFCQKCMNIRHNRERRINLLAWRQRAFNDK